MPSQLFLGFDPGKDKCGIAIVSSVGEILYREVILADRVLPVIGGLLAEYSPATIVIGDATTGKQWQQKLEDLAIDIPIAVVDERYSTLEARQRYWQLHPPTFLQSLVPEGMRRPPKAIDDIVAVILVERFLNN
jgi:RNase H-fold protein (predicted Holliday junction resolvase)